MVEYVFPFPLWRSGGEADGVGGFFGNEGANNSYSQYDLVIMPEGDGFNNTLAAGDSCGDKGNDG